MTDQSQTSNQITLDKQKREVQRQFPEFGSALLQLLERDQSTVCYARPWNAHLAALRVAPSEPTRRQFRITLEIPVLIANFAAGTHLEPRILANLEQSSELRKSTTADKDIAILVTSDPEAVDLVKDRRRFAFPVLVIDSRRLADGEYRNATLRSLLAELLRSVNHFDFSNEITDPADFFGRQDEVEALTKLAVAGQSVGIFGLRRAGKTSLLYRVRSALAERDIDTAYIQLNTLLDADSFRLGLLRGLGNIQGASRTDREPTISPHAKTILPRSRDSITSRDWIYGMNERLDLIDRQVVLLIDEIDLANEDASEFDDSEIEERRQINRVLQQLRGLIQVRNDRGAPHLSFICAGVAASIFTQAVRFDRENQLFGFASARTLGSMPPSEMREMVRTLGKRSGVQFRHPDLFDMLYREYGGHPHLTRQACAVVAESLSSDAAHAVPYSVTHSDLNQAFLQVGEGSPAFAAWQTLESFARWYPGEGALVRDLSNGKLVQLDPTSASHAVGFGLCDKEGTLKMRALARLGVTVR